VSRTEKDPARRDTPVPQSRPPSAGRTGIAGARAERPSEGSNRKTAELPQTGRGAKAPQAEDNDEALEKAAREAPLQRPPRDD
jgi:hypothetical protein